jgi:hypothetical protein
MPPTLPGGCEVSHITDVYQVPSKREALIQCLGYIYEQNTTPVPTDFLSEGRRQTGPSEVSCVVQDHVECWIGQHWALGLGEI